MVKDGEQIKFVDGQSQVGKTMINMQKEEMFDFDSDYSYMDERFLEFQYNNVNFGEISFTSEFSSSYFGLEIVWPNKTALTYQLDCGEYWLFEPSTSQNEEKLTDNSSSLTEEILLSSNFSFFEKQF